MNDMRLEKIREYIACPELGDTHYGRWGALTCEQRLTIYRLLQKIDNYDKLIRSLLEEKDHQKAEIEALDFSVKSLSGMLKTARAEAIKEFAERLKEDALDIPMYGRVVREFDIEYRVKEIGR